MSHLMEIRPVVSESSRADRQTDEHMSASPTGQISVTFYGGDRRVNISLKYEFADNRPQILDSLYI